MMHFAWPWMLLALPLPYFTYRFLTKHSDDSAALKVPFFRRLQTLPQQGTQSASRSKIMAFLLICSWVAFVGAAAKPEWVGEPVSLPANGRDLLVAVDFSGSMSTEDMLVDNQQIARVLIVKYVVGNFLERRVGDRLGLVIFGENAYLYAPLTFDRSTVNSLLQEAQLGIAGNQTAIGDAIGLSVKRLQDRPDTEKTLILLTDGQNTAGELEPRLAADLAAQEKVKIHTIGVGADEMTVSSGLFSSFRRRVNPSADLDEDTLRYISETTGGQYFRARNPEDLERIYLELDKIEPIEQDVETFRPVSSLFYYPLTLSLLLLTLNLAWRSVFSRGAII